MAFLSRWVRWPRLSIIPAARNCGNAIDGYRDANDEGFRFLTRTAKMPSLHDFLA